MKSFFTLQKDFPKEDMSLFSLITSFLRMPLPVKAKIFQYYFKKSFGIKASDHETIWTSFFYFSALHVRRIITEGDSFVVTFDFHDKVLTAAIRGGQSSDIFVFFQVFIAEGYRPLIDFLRKKSIVPKVTIDIGANVGYFSLLILAQFAEELLLAIEPEEGNFHQLRKNVASVVNTNHRLVRAAIWTHKKVVSIETSSGREWAFRVGETETDQTCDAFALSDIVEQHNISSIDMLKLDVEGTEDILFRDPNFLSTLAKVKVMGVEIHDDLADRVMIHRRLEEIEFKFFQIGELTIAWNTNLVHE